MMDISLVRKLLIKFQKKHFFFVPSFLYKSSSDNANSNKRKGKNTIKIRIVGQISSIFDLKTPVQNFL